MADIILAEHRGQAWLVSGDRYIDDLLANVLEADVSIEFVACESESDVYALWIQNCGEPGPGGMPWMIHPAIIRRIRRTASGHAVYFGQWSAMLDDDALSVIKSAVVWAEEFSEAPILLLSYVDGAGPRAIADLANLRSSLIEEELERLGVASARFLRERRDLASVPGAGEESQRIDIVIRPATTPG